MLLLIDHTFDDWEMLEKAVQPLMEEQLKGKKRVVMMSVDPAGASDQPVDLQGNHRGGKTEIDTDETEDQGERIHQMFQYVSQLGRKLNRPGKNVVRQAASDVASVAASTAKGIAAVVGKAAAGVKEAVSGAGGAGKTRVALDHTEEEHEVTNPHGPNLYEALADAFKQNVPRNREEARRYDAIYFIIGHHPKHALASIEGALQRLFVGKDLPLTIVNFGDFSLDTDRYLRSVINIYKNIATGAPYLPRYQVWDPSDRGLAPGDDVVLLLEELRTLDKLQRRVNLQMEQIAQHKASMKLPRRTAERPKPKTAKHLANKKTRTSRFRESGKAATKEAHQHLGTVEATQRLVAKAHTVSSVTDIPGDNVSSKDWLKQNGLKAQRLSIYQEFQDVAFTCSKPGLFLGQSYKTMGTIPWHDGTEKTMHIDIGQMAAYRDRLIGHMRVINERISWLGTGMRRVFGNFSGTNVTFVIDVSAEMAPSLEMMKIHIKSLIQEHLLNLEGRGWFNIVKLDNKPERFKFDMVEITESTLHEAWSWIDRWKPSKEPGRDLKKALELAVNNIRPQAHGEHMIVLACSGIPDQSDKEIRRFATQMLGDGATTVNCVGYNCYQSPEIVILLREISKITGGQFHICIESGTVFDHMHEEDVSWSTDSTLVYEKAEVEFDQGQTLDHYYEIARWVKMGGFVPKVAAAVPSYGDLTNTFKTSLNHVLPEGVSVCLCDGTDAQELRRELFKGKAFLEILDDVVKSLHPPYANMAMDLLHSASSMAPTETWSDAAGSDDEFQERVNAMQRTTGAVSKQRVAAPVLTKTARMRQTHNAHQKKKREEDAAAEDRKSRPKTARLPVDSAGLRMSRYMVANSARPGDLTVTIRQDKELGPGEGRAIPKVPTRPASLPKDWRTMETSRQFLRSFGLRAMHLTEAQFKKSLGYGKSVTVSPRHWGKFIKDVSKARKLYEKRKRWLEREHGVHKLLGTIAEKNVVFAVDVSGSMDPFMEEVIELVTELIRQLPGLVHKFNVLTFGDEVETFSKDHDYGLIEANEPICTCYEGWVRDWQAGGGTNVRAALREASKDPNCEAIYLLSDGLPNESVIDIVGKSTVLDTDGKWHDCFCQPEACTCGPGERYPSVKELSASGIKVHTISFNTGFDSSYNQTPNHATKDKVDDYLKDIAHLTNGRWHEYNSLVEDGEVVIGQGAADGDDIGIMQGEIEAAARWIEVGQSGQHLSATKVKEMTDKRAKRPTATTTPWVPNGSKRKVSATPKQSATRVKVSMPKPRPTRGSILLREANQARTGINFSSPGSSELSSSDEDYDSDHSIIFTSDEEDPVISSMKQDSRVAKVRVEGGGSSIRIEGGRTGAPTVSSRTGSSATSSSKRRAQADRRPNKQVFATATGLISGPVTIGVRAAQKPVAARNPERYRGQYAKYRAFVSDLPEHCTPKDVVAFFNQHLRRFGVSLLKRDVDMPWDPIADRPGLPVAYATFKSEKELIAAIRLTGKVLGGRNVRITTASDPVFDTVDDFSKLMPSVTRMTLA